MEELIRLADEGTPLSASVVLNDGRFYLRLYIPLELYAKHTAKVRVRPKASLVAGFDINPGRINMVIVDSEERIGDVKTRHFPDVTLAGFPRAGGEGANRKVAKFAYREPLGHAKMMVRKRRGIFVQINLAYTSIGAAPLSEKLGLDLHTASAHLLALRFLKSANVC